MNVPLNLVIVYAVRDLADSIWFTHNNHNVLQIRRDYTDNFHKWEQNHSTKPSKYRSKHLAKVNQKNPDMHNP
jgi:hypothetical protein